MTTDIMQQKSFEEKMKERIKDSIGELITDEELSKLVERAVDEVFFKEQVIHKSYGRDEYKPSLICDIIEKLLKKSVERNISMYIDTHPDEINEIINNIVTSGLGNAVLQAVSNKFSMDINMFQTNIENRLNGLNQ